MCQYGSLYTQYDICGFNLFFGTPIVLTILYNIKNY